VVLVTGRKPVALHHIQGRGVSMRWFRAEEPTHEESMNLFEEVDSVLDILNEAGVDTTPGRVEDVLNAKGTYVVKRSK